MYFHFTCINVNRKDVHASMISFNGKYIKNMGACHGFEKNETATMFFLKKPSLVYLVNYLDDVKSHLELIIVKKTSEYNYTPSIMALHLGILHVDYH